MKEYNRVTNEIHAPKDLIERTKAAVKTEEQRLEKEEKKVVTFRKGIVAAAAILVVAVISIPVVRMGIGQPTGQASEWQENIGTKVMMGQEKEGMKKLERDQTMIEVVANLPIHSEEPEETVELEDVVVKVYLEAGETAIAEFTVGEISYQAIQEQGDIEKLLTDVEAYLKELP